MALFSILSWILLSYMSYCHIWISSQTCGHSEDLILLNNHSPFPTAVSTLVSLILSVFIMQRFLTNLSDKPPPFLSMNKIIFFFFGVFSLWIWVHVKASYYITLAIKFPLKSTLTIACFNTQPLAAFNDTASLPRVYPLSFHCSLISPAHSPSIRHLHMIQHAYRLLL